MSVNLNIIVHNMYMYISVCPSIAHCNHRRCDSPSDNHCEYCYYEIADKRYFRGYTRHYDGQMKQCRSKYIRCTIIYQQQYVVETINKLSIIIVRTLSRWHKIYRQTWIKRLHLGKKRWPYIRQVTYWKRFHSYEICDDMTRKGDILI